jgi:hypothetical protein
MTHTKPAAPPMQQVFAQKGLTEEQNDGNVYLKL